MSADILLRSLLLSLFVRLSFICASANSAPHLRQPRGDVGITLEQVGIFVIIKQTGKQVFCVSTIVNKYLFKLALFILYKQTEKK